jgi:hypothetical protein
VTIARGLGLAVAGASLSLALCGRGGGGGQVPLWAYLTGLFVATVGTFEIRYCGVDNVYRTESFRCQNSDTRL